MTLAFDSFLNREKKNVRSENPAHWRWLDKLSSASLIMVAERVYLLKTYQFVHKAHITKVSYDPAFILLSSTIFHPQGGGQPSDIGKIRLSGREGDETCVFNVSMCKVDPDILDIVHTGSFADSDTSLSERWVEGAEVELFVSEDDRRLHARLHSAGHLLDAAMHNCGYDFPPTKGYHFRDAPCVEYKGNIEVEKREEARIALEAECNRLIKRSTACDVMASVDSQTAVPMCGSLGEGITPGSILRLVRVTSDFDWCPCGGTHVENVKEIGRITVTKVSYKKGSLKISYSVSELLAS